MKYVDLSYQNKQIETEVKKKLMDVFNSGQYLMGKEVREFENKLQQYLGMKYVVALSNGTTALQIALKIMGVGYGDEVITTPFTFFATAQSIAAMGATPVFVDINPRTYNIDFTKIEEKITRRTKTIIPVHIFGNPCDMDAINAVARKHGIGVIGDACQAFGGEYKGKKIGKCADISCFSFFLTKNLGAIGEAGAIATDNEEYAIIARALRNHGSGDDGKNAYRIIKKAVHFSDENDNNIESRYINYIVGFNARMDELQAALLNIKMKYIDEWQNKRKKIARNYYLDLDDRYLKQKTISDSVHAYHIFSIESEARNDLREYLKARGIETGIHYPIPLHLQKAFGYLGYVKGDCPVSESLCKKELSLPIWPGMDEEQQKEVITTINTYGR